MEKIVSVKELFQAELDAINNFIVIMEDRKDLNEEEMNTVADLKIVAQYLMDRINDDVVVEPTNQTIH
tara:strand:+ start:803 stop:1006 length:204 start_codon:yes stop_codon:yes gene_type:complete